MSADAIDPDADGWWISKDGVVYLNGERVAKLIQAPMSKRWAWISNTRDIPNFAHKTRDAAADDARRVLVR